MKHAHVYVVVVLTVFSASHAFSQNCPASSGQWGYGPIAVVEIEGDLGLVASGAVLHAVDVSSPTTLEVVGQLTLPGVIEEIAYSHDDWWVVAAGKAGLWTVDLSSPEEPIANQVDLDSSEGSVVAVAAGGRHAFVVEQTGDELGGVFRLSVVDLAVPGAPVLLGSVSDGGSVEDIAAAGDDVYLALRDGRLVVVDVSDPADPDAQSVDPLGQNTQGLPVRVAACDGTVYLLSNLAGGFETYAHLTAISRDTLTEIWSTAWMDTASVVTCQREFLAVVGRSGVYLLDATNPSQLAGSYGFLVDSFVDVDLEGDVAYVADSETGLLTIDVADPTEPVDIGVLILSGLRPLLSMALSGTNLVGTSPNDGLTVVDVADPVRPRLVSSSSSLGNGSDVVASGQFVLVAAGANGVEVIDLSLPETPVLVGAVATEGDAVSVAVDGAYLFVSSEMLEVFDITDPTMPSRVATFDATGLSDLDADRLFLGATDGLRIIDISDPLKPVFLGGMDTDWQAPGAAVTAITSANSLVFVASWTSQPWGGSIHVVDTTDPASPALLGSIDIGNPVAGLIVRDDHLLAGVAERGSILSFDVSDPSRPSPAGSLDLVIPDNSYPSTARMNITGLSEFGSVAYAGLSDYQYWFGGLRVIDLGDPGQPRFSGTLPIDYAETAGVAVGGGVAVTNDGDARIRIFDLADLRSPKDVASVAMPNIDHQIEILETTAYVAGGDTGIRLVDLVDPSRPAEIGSVAMGCRALDFDSGFLYAWGNQRLQVFDVANPRSPIPVGSLGFSSDVTDIAVADGIAVCVSHYGSRAEITIVDVSAPSAPTITGGVTLPGEPTAVAIAGDDVLLTASVSDHPEEHGLVVVDISDPLAPVVVATVETPGDAKDVVVSGNLAFVADSDGGVLILDVSNPEAPVEVRWLMTPGTPSALALSGRSLTVADGDGGLAIFADVGCPVDRPGSQQSVVD